MWPKDATYEQLSANNGDIGQSQSKHQEELRRLAVRPRQSVIRSGTASDGTVGLRAIESEGGKTVKFHKQKITEKLGIHTGTVVTAYAIRHGTAYAEQGFAVTSRYRLCRTPPD
ncbi:MAG: hypothetical protein WBL61_12965 [Bryobacteraceae bacterium]